MLKPKKKISRKELKQDKLVTWYFKISEKASLYQKKITTGALILLGLILALYFIIIKPAQENKEIASTALANIMGFYDYRQYQVAMEGIRERSVIGLKDIVEQYGSTESGEVAKVYLGNCYFIIKDYDNALKCFTDYNGGNKIYEVSALAGAASVYEAKSSFAEAAAYFEKAAVKASDEIQTPENLFFAARNYNLAGDKKKSVELLEKIKTTYPKSIYAKDIERYIAEYQG
jgi:tetratricopeptide (TPR) repeat protein